MSDLTQQGPQSYQPPQGNREIFIKLTKNLYTLSIYLSTNLYGSLSRDYVSRLLRN